MSNLNDVSHGVAAKTFNGKEISEARWKKHAFSSKKREEYGRLYKVTFTMSHSFHVHAMSEKDAVEIVLREARIGGNQLDNVGYDDESITINEVKELELDEEGYPI